MMSPRHVLLFAIVMATFGACHSLASTDVERENLRDLLSGLRATRRVLVCGEQRILVLVDTVESSVYSYKASQLSCSLVSLQVNVRAE